MNCPSCNGNLSMVILHESDVGICPLCEGIWFDSGSLKTVVDKMIASGEVDTPEATVYLEPRKIEMPDRQEGLRMCPDCGLVMKKFNYSADSNVFIDKCTQCGGIWTDKGELMAIAKYIKGNPRAARIAEEIIKSDKKTRRTSRMLEWIGKLIEFVFFWI